MTTILIIEDDRDLRDSLKEFLEEEGFSILVAVNGKDALEVLSKAEPLPNLILLDLMMPIMDGQSFRRAQLQVEALARIPVVVTSADPHATEKLKGIPAESYLKKPADLDTILDVVRRFTT